MIEQLSHTQDIDIFLKKHLGKKIALVPTMGNLHEGHLNLMRIAQQNADIIIASIFVNPTQFAANEDLDSYPKTIKKDLAQLEKIGVHAVFTPDIRTIYPDGADQTLNIFIPNMMEILCATDRPTHFQGVAIVVLKLFQLIRPNIAIFGEKDFQQLCIIKKLVRELFLDIDIIAAPIIRDSFGLALSSRNQYLSTNEKNIARKINLILKDIKISVKKGEPFNQTLQKATRTVDKLNIKLEYLEIRDERDLSVTSNPTRARVFIGVRIGKTRLIDNLSLT